MNRLRDPDSVIGAWLEDGPSTLPAETRRAIVVGLRTQSRARRMVLLGGIVVSSLPRLATAVGVVLAVGILGVIALSNRSGGVGGEKSASPFSSPAAVAPSVPSVAPSAPAATPSTPAASSAAISTANWKSFSSNRYKYDAKYPTYQTAIQSTRQWTDADASNWLSPAYDKFEGPVGITAMAITLPAGTTRDDWIASHLEGPIGSNTCTHTLTVLPTSEVDGKPVVFWRESTGGECGGTFAFVTVGNRLYDFFIGLPGYEPTLEAFLSTVKFR